MKALNNSVRVLTTIGSKLFNEGLELFDEGDEQFRALDYYTGLLWALNYSIRAQVIP